MTSPAIQTTPRSSPAASTSVSPQARALLAAFNTWAYKREQPGHLSLLNAAAERAVALGRPLPFALYWGKGPRDVLAAPEEACLDYLASMAARIGSAHKPGATIQLVLTDTHARHNGHGEAGIDAYFAGIDAAARNRGFQTRRLSRLVAGAPAEADAMACKQSPDADLLDQLTDSARKWYRGTGGPRYGARIYYAMNMVERRAVEAAFPDTVFVTFNNSQVRGLFPERMPIFYMYSVRKGIAVKPWFMDAA